MKILVSANQNEEACRRRERICPKYVSAAGGLYAFLMVRILTNNFVAGVTSRIVKEENKPSEFVTCNKFFTCCSLLPFASFGTWYYSAVCYP